MDESDRAARAASFGKAAEAYERGRPAYPIEAVEWMLPGNADYVVDLGAGTGKLTRLLVDRAARVVAVDPSAGMLDVLRTVVEDADAREGSAENIPVDSGVVDAVLCAQAWHWADPVRASVEVGRVLRAGGTLGLVWNFRDRRVPWVAELDRILSESNTAETIGTPDVQEPFGELERFEIRWSDRLTRDGFRDLVLSRSFMINSDGSRQAGVLSKIDALIADQGESIDLPYVTVAFRTRRP